MTEEQVETAEIQAEELAVKIKSGKAVFKQLSKKLEGELVFAAQPLSHWKDYFKLNIPDQDLNPIVLKGLDMKLMELYHEASFYYSMANSLSQMIKNGAESNYQTIFLGLVEQFKGTGQKLPAAATLENLARIQNMTQDSASWYAEVEVKFWREVLDNLSSQRKIIENASLNISVELKALNHEKALDSLVASSTNHNKYNGQRY
jgi:hypothetical protein